MLSYKSHDASDKYNTILYLLKTFPIGPVELEYVSNKLESDLERLPFMLIYYSAYWLNDW